MASTYKYQSARGGSDGDGEWERGCPLDSDGGASDTQLPQERELDSHGGASADQWDRGREVVTVTNWGAGATPNAKEHCPPERDKAILTGQKAYSHVD